MSTRLRWAAPAAAVGLSAVLIAIAISDGEGPLGIGVGGGGPGFAAAVGDPTPYDGRSPREPAGTEQRVLVGLPRPALGERRDAATLSDREQRRYVRSLVRESRALRSALGARGIVLRDVVGYERVWNGFAATVRTRDLTALGSNGVRPDPVRRFYPAHAEPVPAAPDTGGTVPSVTPNAKRDTGGTVPSVSLLSSGVALEGAEEGYDAVGQDSDPAPGRDPRDARREETGGTALAQVLTGLGMRVRPVRVSSFHAGPTGTEEYATTDTLLTGLERLVDLDRDGDAADHDALALLGVSAPYTGLSNTPEAEAIRAARALGLRVVAPTGGEGRGRGGAGTIGSPAAAPDALAVGALGMPSALARLELGGRYPAVLLNPSAANPKPLPQVRVEIEDPAAFLRRPPALAGRVAIVGAGESPGAQAAAAAAAGADAVVLTSPGSTPLAALPSGRVAVPVYGVTGDAAEALLEEKLPRAAAGPPASALAASGATGAAGAAAGAAGAATGAVGASPAATGATAPAGATGPAGPPLRFGPLQPGRIGRATAPAPASSRGPTLDGLAKPDFAAPGVARLPGNRLIAGTAVAAATIAADLARRLHAGKPLTAARDQAVRSLRGARPKRQAPAVPLGALRLTRKNDRVTGVRFTLGAFERGDPLGKRPGTLIQAASRLDLELVDASDRTVRRLTPPGGARALLPGEYAYTLPASTLKDLDAGRYAFRATVKTPRRRGVAARRSGRFSP